MDAFVFIFTSSTMHEQTFRSFITCMSNRCSVLGSCPAKQSKAQRWRWNVKRMKENNNDGNRENNEEILNKRTLPKRYHFQLETTETLKCQRKPIMCVSITIDCNGMFHDESRGHTMLTRQIYVFVRNTNTDHNRTSFSLFDSSSF